jgi:hypothetical protein
VREHREAAVLRLDRVVRDPQAGGADLRAAVLVVGRTLLADQVLECLPAVRPDRVFALLGIAVGLVAAGVDDLEVVDVPVGLVEVAIVVEVVAVPLVIRREVRLDLLVAAALGVLIRDPRVEPSATSRARSSSRKGMG